MSPVGNDDQVVGLIKRLDAMLAMYVRTLHPDSISDQIRALGGTGLSSSEIGRIVGRDVAYVGTILRRKVPKKRKAKKS